MVEPLTEIDKRLLHAVAEDQITPVFQPILALRNRALYGFEVLTRWCDPNWGPVSPTEFVPVIERAGLLDQLTERSVRTACKLAVQWPGKFVLAFNVSPTQLLNPELPNLICRPAAAAGFPPSRIHIEITETALLADEVAARVMVERLKSTGMGIVLDDFGTGYSSLARLLSLPFTKLKIDASFVRSMLEQRQSRKIVTAVVGLGESLGLPIVAEGVETEEQAALLQRIGCDLGQGWLFGPGLPGDEVPDAMMTIGEHPAHVRSPDLSLEQRSAQLEAIYNNSGVAIGFIDANQRYVSVNKIFAQRLGLAADSIIGRQVQDVLPDVEAKRLSWEKARPSQPNPAFEFRLNDATDLVSLQPVPDEAGDLLGYSIVGIDISERIRTEQALRDSLEHHRRAAELSPQMSWAAAPSGRLVFASPRFLLRVGLSSEQLQDGGLGQLIHPKQRDLAADSWALSIATGNVFDSDVKMVMAGGSYRWMRVYAAPHKDGDGSITRWYGSIEDIHSRKSRKKLAQDADCTALTR